MKMNRQYEYEEVNMYLSHGEYSSAFKIRTLPTLICPYWKKDSKYCDASVMTVAIDRRRKTQYCDTEAYDCCAIFSQRCYGEPKQLLRAKSSPPAPDSSGLCGQRHCRQSSRERKPHAT